MSFGPRSSVPCRPSSIRKSTAPASTTLTIRPGTFVVCAYFGCTSRKVERRSWLPMPIVTGMPASSSSFRYGALHW